MEKFLLALAWIFFFLSSFYIAESFYKYSKNPSPETEPTDTDAKVILFFIISLAVLLAKYVL